MLFYNKHFYKYLFVISIFLGFSFYRFFIIKDYFVSYEINCNQYTQICFKGEKDDKHSEKYYYARIQKYAADIFMECGRSTIGCNKAAICLSSDKKCFITYCDSLKNGNECENITQDDIPKEQISNASSTNL